ncbi:hypothetical protein HOP50_11g61430 [Chloropicon primus]|uniref:Uncharacterized protein n=1 Tax=Chloropicon primus TaxID=1764295 RepID=A0A5B8MSV9_9CHLO|nr:hypothetical protein A3770_11p61210 [Chloropicon primus]UPR02816.1 hypothetical protein HOP50_11g61430 [Chloropicon primus]|eukprot:QDZ23603.1 hypothetical protein A3770_11p61210 [Chloropicon primus]
MGCGRVRQERSGTGRRRMLRSLPQRSTRRGNAKAERGRTRTERPHPHQEDGDGGWRVEEGRLGRRRALGLGISLAGVLLRRDAKAEPERELETEPEVVVERKVLEVVSSEEGPLVADPVAKPVAEGDSGQAESLPSPSSSEGDLREPAADEEPSRTSPNPSALPSGEAPPPPDGSERGPEAGEQEKPPEASQEKLEKPTEQPVEKEKEKKENIFSVRKSKVRELQELRNSLKEKEFALMEKQQELEGKEQTIIVMKEQLALEKKIRDILIEEKEKAVEEAKLTAGLCAQGGMMP